MFSFLDIGILTDIERWISVFLIPMGIILLLYGYRLYKLFIALTGFVFGFVIGLIVGELTGEPIITGLLCGVLSALLFYFLYKLGIFLLGFLAGSVISVLITISASTDVNLFVYLIAGLLGGILALYIEKAIIVILSAYNGAAISVSGFAWLVYPEYMAQLYSLFFTDPQLALSNVLTFILVNLIVMTVGILFQYNIIPNRPGISLKGSAPKIKSENFKSTPMGNRSAEPQLVPTENKEANIEKKEVQHVGKDHKKLTVNSIRSSPPYNPPERDYNHSNKNSSSGIKTPGPVTATTSKDFYSKSITVIRDSYVASLTNIKTDLKSITSAIVNRFPTRESVVATELVQMLFKLQILNGQQNGITTEVYGEYNGSYYSSTIGREKSNERNHICLDDPNNHVSRYHAEFAMINKRFYVRSLSKTNLLLLNGNEVAAEQFTPLSPGDQIDLAHIKAVVVSL